MYVINYGAFTSAEDAASGTDITSRIPGADMTKTDAGYAMTRNDEPCITMVMFDSEGNAVGCLPFYLRIWAANMDGHINWYNLYLKSGDSTIDVSDSERSSQCRSRGY